jgi:hypothetical protein
MRRVLRWLGIAVALGGAAFAAVFVGARFHDGPIGPFKGGAFRAGEVAAPPADWSFASDDQTLELELPAEVGLAITTWLVVEGGALYVPCGVAESKSWPHAVVRDGNVRVRIDGKIYELRATRVDDPATLARVVPLLAAKYDVNGDGFGSRDWLFALAPR